MGRFRLRILGSILVGTAALAAPAALADSFDEALATCGRQALTQPFAAFGDNAPYFAAGGPFQLSAGATATAAPVCIDAATATVRLLVTGGGVLRVDAVFKDQYGGVRSLPVGVIAGASSGASPGFNLKLAALSAIGGQLPLGVSFRLTAIIGSWQVDGVFVDPLLDCC